jgi:hypothetical protein
VKAPREALLLPIAETLSQAIPTFADSAGYSLSPPISRMMRHSSGVIGVTERRNWRSMVMPALSAKVGIACDSVSAIGRSSASRGAFTLQVADRAR